MTSFKVLPTENIDKSVALRQLDSLAPVQALSARLFTSITPTGSERDIMESPTEFMSQVGSPLAPERDSDEENRLPESVSQLQFATQIPLKSQYNRTSGSPVPKKKINTAADGLALLEPPRKKARLDNNNEQHAPGVNHLSTRTTTTIPKARGRTQGLDLQRAHEAYSRVLSTARFTSHHDPSRSVNHDAGSNHQDPVQTSGDLGETSQPRSTKLLENPTHDATLSATSSREVPDATQRQPAQGKQDVQSCSKRSHPLSAKLVRGRFLPRYLFKIPSGQRRMLESEVTWQPPLVGQPAPFGCIPPKLLEAMAEKVDRAAGKGRSARNVQEPIMKQKEVPLLSEPAPEKIGDKRHLPSHRLHDEQPRHPPNAIASAPIFDDALSSDEEEVDEAVGSQDWPDSPVRGKACLPPDSSPESPDPRIATLSRDKSTFREDGSLLISARIEEEMKSSNIRLTYGVEPALGDVDVDSCQATSSGKQASTTDQSANPTIHDKDAQEVGTVGPSIVETGTAPPSSVSVQQQSLTQSTEYSTMSPDDTKVQVKRTPMTKQMRALVKHADTQSRHSSGTGQILDADTSDIVTQIPATICSPSASQDYQTQHLIPAKSPTATSRADDRHIDPGPEATTHHHVNGEPDRHTSSSSPTIHREAVPARALAARAPVIDQTGEYHAERADLHVSPIGAPLRSEKPIQPRQARDSQILAYSSPSGNFQDLVSMAQANRRDFMRALKDNRTASKKSDVTGSPTDRSARASVWRCSSEFRDTGRPSPATSIVQGQQEQAVSCGSFTLAEMLFQKFRTTYPSYVGTLSHFQQSCRLIQKLQKEDRAPHVFLWDDFIHRHRGNYQTYIARQCAAGTATMPYISYYNDFVQEPTFVKGVVKSDFIKSSFEQVRATSSSALSTPVQRESQSSQSRQLALPGSRELPRVDDKNRPAESDSGSQKITRHEKAAEKDSPSAGAVIVAELNTDWRSSPPILPEMTVDKDSKDSQSSFVESWLNDASHLESPILGEDSNVSHQQQMAMLETAEIQESDTDDMFSEQDQSVSPESCDNSDESDQLDSSVDHADDQVDEEVAEPVGWWSDMNTTFKEWARAHEAVTRTGGIVNMMTDRRGGILPQLRETIDFGSWRR